MNRKLFKVAMVGDIVGSPGRTAFARYAARARGRGEVDAVVVNVENAAAGRGVTFKMAGELLEAGADVLTLGDHAWDQKDLPSSIDREPRIVRPANFARSSPGKGWVTVPTPCGPLTVILLVGRTFMNPAECPFHAVDDILNGRRDLGRMIVVDMHAEATSEKIAMGWHLDGRVSAVVGTHTHVQTADEAILPKGTAYLTDLGMTGPKRSVLGRQIEPVLRRFVTGLPAKFEIATDDVCVEGAVIAIDSETGRAVRIKRFRDTTPDGSGT